MHLVDGVLVGANLLWLDMVRIICMPINRKYVEHTSKELNVHMI